MENALKYEKLHFLTKKATRFSKRVNPHSTSKLDSLEIRKDLPPPASTAVCN